MVEKYVEHDGKLHAVMSLSNKIHITAKFVRVNDLIKFIYRLSVPAVKASRPSILLAGLYCYLEELEVEDYVLQFDKRVETGRKGYKPGSLSDELNITVEFVNKTAGLAYRLGSASHEFERPLVLLAYLYSYLEGLEAEDYVLQFDTNEEETV